MSQDIIADTLNQIMNAKRARKESIVVHRHSKILVSLLEIAKSNGYVKSYKVDGNNLEIFIGELHDCNAIKPRFSFTKKTIEKYLRRFLPGLGVGIIIVSTNQGLMTHSEAVEKEIGGVLVAYFY